MEIRWGIIGTGDIAHEFADSLNACEALYVKHDGTREITRLLYQIRASHNIFYPCE